MKVLEKGFLNKANGIKGDWTEKFPIKDWDSEKRAKWVEEYENKYLNTETKTKWLDESIRKKGGVRVQLEDWSEDYEHHAYADVVVAYPLSKKDTHKPFGPQLNRSFRCAFHFKSTEEARDAYEKLVSGERVLSDYGDYMELKQYRDCI